MDERPVPRAFGARFEAVVRRLPHKTALVEGGRTIDYATLESTSRAIAARIEAAAAGRPGFVALLFSRKTPGVLAMTAAMRCGRAYVPLDNGDPDERLRFVLRDCAPVVLLVDRELAARARALAGEGCAIVAIDDDESPTPGFAMPDVGPDALASVFYTSGSTGTPKGVMQTHEAALFFADAYMRRLSVGEGDRLSLLFALNFAALVVSVHGCFLHGATLCAYDMRGDGIPGLARWLDRERVSVIHSIPTVFRELVARLAPGEKLRHLRAIDLGGEASLASDVASFLEHTNDDAIFVVHLASTEVHVIAQHVIAHGDPPPVDTILPAGVPPEGVEVRIRRDDGRDAGTDEVGAIVVSSRHLSPGYWQRPDLNAQHFPEDPWHPGARCNVSGDRGYLDAAGRLHFLGRAGSRVKIRGHTVDLAEVEAALAATAGITRAAVLAPNPGQGMEADRIVAYVSAASSFDVDGPTLRRRLAERLPPYMLPSAFVFLDALPTTPTGKIDRLALAKHEPAGTPRERLSAAADAVDELELGVAGVFERLLKVSPIGPRDDFFLLGGDSLLVADLQNRLRDAFGTDVPDIHRNSTVAAVASAIRRHRTSAAAPRAAPSLLVPLRETGSRPPLFLVHGRLGQALVSPHFLELLGDDQPVWAFRLRGLDGLEPPHESLESMAADYAAEIRRIQPHGPYLIGSLCIGAFVAMEIGHVLRASGEAVLPLLLIDPPQRAFAMNPDEITEERLRVRLQRRRAASVGDAPLDEPSFASGSVRAARAFERAIGDYRPRAYDGHVCMLLSEDRLARAPRTQWRKIYAGEISQFIIADTHHQALTTHSPKFASAIAASMRRIHAALDA